MSLILNSALRLLGRGGPPGNAGLPQPDPVAAASPFGITADVTLKSLAGPVRAAPPTPYKSDGKNIRLLGFQAHPVVQACVRVVVDLLAVVPFHVYRKTGPNKFERIENHPAQALLDRPAFGFSARQLRAGFATDFSIYGNAFWRLIRARPLGPITGIRRINPEGVQVVYVDGNQDVIAWTWIDHFGRVKTTGAEDIVHFKDLQAAPPHLPDVFGHPRAASAINSIVGDSEATRYVRQIVTNDGTPTLALLMNDNITQLDAETAQERWHQLSVERGRRGRAAFLGGVKDVKPIGFNLQNLEFPDLRRVNREDICAAFGVDPRMIGIASAVKDAGMSGEQYTAARSRLIAHTVEPMLDAEEDVVNLWLAPEFGDVFIMYDREVLRDLAEDDQQTSTRIRGEFTDGLRSWEESREALHLSPLPDPTDAILVPTVSKQLVPAAVAVVDPTEEPEPAPAPPPAPAPEPKRSEPDVPEPVAAVIAEAAARGRLDERVAKGFKVYDRGVALSKEQRQSLWSLFDERATREEQEYRRAAMRLFEDERASVAKIFHTQTEAAKLHRATAPSEHDDHYVSMALARVRQGYKPGGEYHHRWISSYRSLITKTYMLGGQELLDAAKLDFNLDNPTVHAAIQARTEKLASHVTDTTAKQISAAVAAGRKAAMGIGDIARLVQQTVYGPMTTSRAAMIARTETIGALNQGEYDTATSQGVMRSKEWLTQQDDRVRDSHGELDGVRLDIEDTFDNGCAFPGDPAGGPDEVINCRCTLLYYDESASERREGNHAAPVVMEASVAARAQAPASSAPVEMRPVTAPMQARFTTLHRDAEGKVVGFTTLDMPTNGAVPHPPEKKI